MSQDSQYEPLPGWPALAEIRKSRNISIGQVAELTKIRPFYVEAIENGELQKLPGGIYTINYIRQYARAIQYEEEDLLAHLPPQATPLSLSLQSRSQGPAHEPGGRRQGVDTAARWQLVVSAFGKLSSR